MEECVLHLLRHIAHVELSGRVPHGLMIICATALVGRMEVEYLIG